jgi:hypothetical protein
LIPLGLGQIIEPLLFGYFLVLFYVVISILDWRSYRSTGVEETLEEAEPESDLVEEQPDSESGRTNRGAG